MCQQIAILVEQSQTRYVSQCEHGIVHLVWDGVNIHLTPEVFLRLAIQIETQSRRDAEIGQYRLLVGNLSICIPAQDLKPLAELITVAAFCLTDDKPIYDFLCMLPLAQAEPRFYSN